jgi:hypothetical protein
MNVLQYLLKMIHEISQHHRTFGSILIIVALALGTAQWVQSSVDATAADAAQRISPVSPAAGQFEYFPSQYVNQAKQAEEHIQAF